MSLLVLIDDDDIAHTIFKDFLAKQLNFDGEIRCFLSVSEAVSFFNEGNKPSLLFLDLNMPEINGWEMLEHYNDDEEDILNGVPIYVLTTSNLKSDKLKSSEYSNVEGFIEKPLNVGVLNGILISHGLK